MLGGSDRSWGTPEHVPVGKWQRQSLPQTGAWGHTFADVATTGLTCPNGATEVEKRHHARLVAHVGRNEVRSRFPAVKTATSSRGGRHYRRVRIPRGPISGCAPQLVTHGSAGHGTRQKRPGGHIQQLAKTRRVASLSKAENPTCFCPLGRRLGRFLYLIPGSRSHRGPRCRRISRQTMGINGHVDITSER